MIRAFLFVSDSNGVGYNMSAATLPASLASFNYGATYIFSEAATYWGAIIPGTNTGTANHPEAWGPETAFAAAIRTAFPDDITLIIQVERGQTPVATATGLDWNVNSVGEMFDATTDTIARADAAFFVATGLHLPTFSGTFITSGPNDAMDQARADAYEINMADLINAARFEWGTSYVGLSRMTDDATAMPHNFTVRVAQWSIDQADPLVESFKTIGFAMQPDQIHYAADGYVSLGQAFFDNWVN